MAVALPPAQAAALRAPRRARWEEPLASFPGLAPLDRARRYHLRNRPATGRRGPVSEFVVVLRHRDGVARSSRLLRERILAVGARRSSQSCSASSFAWATSAPLRTQA